VFAPLKRARPKLPGELLKLQAQPRGRQGDASGALAARERNRRPVGADQHLRATSGELPCVVGARHAHAHDIRLDQIHAVDGRIAGGGLAIEKNAGRGDVVTRPAPQMVLRWRKLATSSGAAMARQSMGGCKVISVLCQTE
jgi:hypothetical protein